MLSENVLITYETEGITYRILSDKTGSPNVCVIEMEKMRWPKVKNRNELILDLNDGRAKVIKKDHYIIHTDESQLSDVAKRKWNSSWELISYTFNQLEDESLVFNSKYRDLAMKETMKVYKVGYSTLKNYLIKYWQGGMIKSALIPRYNFCGAPGKERNNNGKKRGRPRSITSGKGVNIDEKIKKHFEMGLNKHYYTNKKNTLKMTYELILMDYFSDKKITDKGKEIPVIKDINTVPTYHQFLYWFKKMNDPRKELIQRFGSRNYYQNHRSIIGDSTQDAGLGPGTLWQIDATQFDVYLVSSVNRNIIVGRPTLILVIDVFSRMIVGMNITLESFNSYTGAMVALANAMLPKEDYCKQFGISLNKNEWDVHCIPQRIFADRGELNNSVIENAIAKLGITIQNAPPYRADYKGIIEQAFEQLNMKVKPFVDGVVPNKNNTVERGDVDYRLKSNLTINEFTKIILKCVLYHNNHHVLSDYVLDEMMLEDEVEKVPTKIWDYGRQHMKGRFRTLPESTIKMHLLPTATASVTARGVKYKKMLYASDYTLKNHWYQQARLNGARKIKVWFDPRDMSHIYVLDEEDEFHRLTILEHLTVYEGRNMEEIDKLIDYKKSMEKRSKEKELQAKLELYNDIEMVVENVRTKFIEEKDETLSKAQKLKGIRSNQKEERELLRQKEWIPYEDKNDLLSEYEVESESSEVTDELDIFRALQNIDGSCNNE